MNLNKSGVDEPDRELFVRLIMRHDRPIRAFLRGLLPTAADVDEVMQEVSVIAWRKFGQLDDPQDFRRWVCVIARYEVLMHRRWKVVSASYRKSEGSSCCTSMRPSIR